MTHTTYCHALIDMLTNPKVLVHCCHLCKFTSALLGHEKCWTIVKQWCLIHWSSERSGLAMYFRRFILTRFILFTTTHLKCFERKHNWRMYFVSGVVHFFYLCSNSRNSNIRHGTWSVSCVVAVVPALYSGTAPSSASSKPIPPWAAGGTAKVVRGKLAAGCPLDHGTAFSRRWEVWVISLSFFWVNTMAVSSACGLLTEVVARWPSCRLAGAYVCIYL